MPEFVIKSSAGRYFKIDPDKPGASQCSVGEATGFPDAEAALAALNQAAKAVVERVSGGKGGKLPVWAKTASTMEGAKWSFAAVPRPTLAELMGVTEIHYVRSAEFGWLCRVGRRSNTAYAWGDNFAMAAGFADLAQAKAAVADLHPDDIAIFKASSVFTGVERLDPKSRHADDLRDAIDSACQSREIQREIEAGAKARFEAWESAAESETAAIAKPKKAARL